MQTTPVEQYDISQGETQKLKISQYVIFFHLYLFLVIWVQKCPP